MFRGIQPSPWITANSSTPSLILQFFHKIKKTTLVKSVVLFQYQTKEKKTDAKRSLALP